MKRAFTILEVVVAMALLVTIIGFVTPMLLRGAKTSAAVAQKIQYDRIIKDDLVYIRNHKTSMFSDRFYINIKDIYNEAHFIDKKDISSGLYLSPIISSIDINSDIYISIDQKDNTSKIVSLIPKNDIDIISPNLVYIKTIDNTIPKFDINKYLGYINITYKSDTRYLRFSISSNQNPTLLLPFKRMTDYEIYAAPDDDYNTAQLSATYSPESGEIDIQPDAKMRDIVVWVRRSEEGNASFTRNMFIEQCIENLLPDSNGKLYGLIDGSIPFLTFSIYGKIIQCNLNIRYDNQFGNYSSINEQFAIER